MDPHFFVRKGIEDRKRDEKEITSLENGGELTAPANLDLFNFDHGGP